MPQSTLFQFFQFQNTSSAARVNPRTEAQPHQLSDASSNAEEAAKERDFRGDPQLTVRQGADSAFLPHIQPLSLVENANDNISRVSLQVSGGFIVSIKADHLSALKRLTGNLLPVSYPDKFFEGAVSEPIPSAFSRVAVVDDKPVGWIRCRIDPFPEPTEPPSQTKPIYNRIYVQALCLLAPYRGLGIATALLDAVTSVTLVREHHVAHIYAHVWESNEEALEWYDRRGFKQVVKVDQYYRRLRPNGAWIVRKDLAWPG